jgi:hypothetical protein
MLFVTMQRVEVPGYTTIRVLYNTLSHTDINIARISLISEH